MKELLSELYQVLGELDAPAKVLDQVAAAIAGQPLPHATLLPFAADADPIGHTTGTMHGDVNGNTFFEVKLAGRRRLPFMGQAVYVGAPPAGLPDQVQQLLDALKGVTLTQEQIDMGTTAGEEQHAAARQVIAATERMQKVENASLVKAIYEQDTAAVAAEAERRQADPARPQAVGFFSGWVEGGEDGQPVEFMVTAYGDLPREGTKLYALPPRDVLMALAEDVNDAALNFLGKPADLNAIVDRYAPRLPLADEPARTDVALKIIELANDHFENGGSSVLRTANNCIAEIQELARVLLPSVSQAVHVAPQASALPDGDLPDAVIKATAEAIGSAYDCMRVWSAWGVGTMGPDDFLPVADDGDRVAEIARAVIGAWLADQRQANKPDSHRPSEEEIQAAFEDWISRTLPGGDAEEVQRQFESSSDYKDLFADRYASRLPVEMHSTGLNDRKAAEIIQSQGFTATGYVLTGQDGRYALCNGGAVRWLDKADYQRTMFPGVEHSSVPVPSCPNQYGLDTPYFVRWLNRVIKKMDYYRPDDFARELGRMAAAADKTALLQDQLSGAVAQKGTDQ